MIGFKNGKPVFNASGIISRCAAGVDCNCPDAAVISATWAANLSNPSFIPSFKNVTGLNTTPSLASGSADLNYVGNCRWETSFVVVVDEISGTTYHGVDCQFHDVTIQGGDALVTVWLESNGSTAGVFGIDIIQNYADEFATCRGVSVITRNIGFSATAGASGPPVKASRPVSLNCAASTGDESGSATVDDLYSHTVYPVGDFPGPPCTADCTDGTGILRIQLTNIDLAW